MLLFFLVFVLFGFFHTQFQKFPTKAKRVFTTNYSKKRRLEIKTEKKTRHKKKPRHRTFSLEHDYLVMSPSFIGNFVQQQQQYLGHNETKTVTKTMERTNDGSNNYLFIFFYLNESKWQKYRRRKKKNKREDRKKNLMRDICAGIDGVVVVINTPRCTMANN